MLNQRISQVTETPEPVCHVLDWHKKKSLGEYSLNHKATGDGEQSRIATSERGRNRGSKKNTIVSIRHFFTLYSVNKTLLGSI